MARKTETVETAGDVATQRPSHYTRAGMEWHPKVEVSGQTATVKYPGGNRIVACGVGDVQSVIDGIAAEHGWQKVA